MTGLRLSEVRICVQAGDGLVGRFPHALVVMPEGGPSRAVNAVLGRCASIVGGPAKAVATQLGAGMAPGLPAFATVADTDDGLALYLHGAAEATVIGPARPVRISTPADPAWVWRVLPEAFASVGIGGAGAPPSNRIDGPLNLRAGVTLGGGAVLVPSEITARLEPVPVPLVPGIRCPSGHFNRPEARYCSIDGLALQVTHNTRAPRPPLGSIIFDDGSAYRLDADYVLGREPERDDAVRAGRARPLPLADTTREISRVHAAVRLDGWDVMVVDLGSVNGTRVLRPGEPDWIRLAQHQPTPVSPGTRVRLGQRSFEYQVRGRRG